MNNIEILEELKEFLLSTNHEPQFNINQYTSAIENLIKENKKLKDKNMKMAVNGGSIRAKLYIEENYIPKSKLKEIIYPTPENPIPFEIQSSEMYKKLEKLVEGE